MLRSTQLVVLLEIRDQMVDSQQSRHEDEELLAMEFVMEAKLSKDQRTHLAWVSSILELCGHFVSI